MQSQTQSQDTSGEFLLNAYDWLEKNWKILVGVLVLILMAWGAYSYYAWKSEQNEVLAGEALSTLMVNSPVSGGGSQLASQLQQVAQKYAGTAAGQRAQLQAAAALFYAENYAEAQLQFQKYLENNQTGPLVPTATLGVASCLEAQNKLDQAATTYQRVLSAFSDSSCVAPAEFGLGRIAEQQNKWNEALSHFENVARSAMNSSMGQEAMMRGTELRTKIAAATPKPAVTATNALKTSAPGLMSVSPATNKP